METRLVVCARDYLNTLSASTLSLSVTTLYKSASVAPYYPHFSSGTSVYRWFYRYIHDNNDANETVYNRQVAKLLLKQKSTVNKHDSHGDQR